MNSIVALITPFTELGEVDWIALADLIDWHVESGTQGLVLAGSTGEGSALSREEREKLFALALERAKGKLFLVANVGTNLTSSTVEAARRAKALGFDAGMAIVPYYNRPNFEGCRRHFEALSNELPFILYHHPGRTGTALSALELSQLATLPNLIGIKDASGDLALAGQLRMRTDKLLYTGDDLLALAHLATGFDGSISIVGNVIPDGWSQFVGEMKYGNLEKARELFYRFFPLCASLVKETNPQGVKYAASLLGKCGSNFRLPLIEPQEETKREIRKQLDSHISMLEMGTLRS